MQMNHRDRNHSLTNGYLNYPRFVLPMSSEQLSEWRRLISPSLSPIFERSRSRIFSTYTSRLIAEEGISYFAQPMNPLDLERQSQPSLLGVWSSSPSVHLGRGMNLPNSQGNQDSLIPIPPEPNENIVINIETDPTSEFHQRPTPLPGHSVNEDLFQISQPHNGVNTYNSRAIAETSALVNAAPHDSQSTEHGPGLSINGESLSNLLETNPQLRNALVLAWQYFFVILIVLIKIIYDRFISLLIILVFFVGFVISNKVVKLAVSHQNRHSKRLTLCLLLVLVSIPFSIYIFYHTTVSNLYYSAVLLPSDISFLNLGELLWIVIITDFVLKLASVFVKGLFSLLPNILVHYKSRGKHLAIIELTSQLLRSLAPVQPWISYLLDSYAGIQKVFGLFLLSVYMLCKGPDIIHRMKNLHQAVKKFLQSSTHGSVPSSAQLKKVGNICPICQDDFVLPTILQCKHIFCEHCATMWFNRERTCPMCRAKVADDPSYKDGGTSFSIQLY